MPIDVDGVVLSNDRLSSDYNVLKVAAPAIANSARPGQFVMVKAVTSPAGGEPLLRRPFSVFEVTRDSDGAVDGLSLLNKTVGVVTRALYSLQRGQRLRCLGPLGVPFSEPSAPGEAWMVAGGVGLAPFLRLAEIVSPRDIEVTLFYGARSSDDLYYVERFQELGVEVVVTTENGTRGQQGVITTPLAQALSSRTTDRSLTLYACGPTGMMRAVAELAGQHAYRCEVSLEPMMGCGLGGCYSCVVPIRAPDAPSRFVRSCLEGPVFRGDHVSWEDLR